MWRVTRLCAAPIRKLAAMRHPARVTDPPVTTAPSLRHHATSYAPHMLGRTGVHAADEPGVVCDAWINECNGADGGCVGGEAVADEDTHRLDRVAQILAPSKSNVTFSNLDDEERLTERCAGMRTTNDLREAARWSEDTIRRTLHRYSCAHPTEPCSAANLNDRASVAELGALLDHLVTLPLQHPQKLSWGMHGCHLAHTWQLPVHCCRLFCSYASAMANTESWPRDRSRAAYWLAALEAVIAAAGSTRDTVTLRLCLSIVQCMPSFAGEDEAWRGVTGEQEAAGRFAVDIAASSVPEMTASSVAEAGVHRTTAAIPGWRAGRREVLALRLYAQCIACLLCPAATFPACQAHCTEADHASRAALHTTATTAARTILLVMRPELWPTCVAVSRRRMMYKTTLRQGVAAVWWGVFSAWCAVYDRAVAVTAQPVRQWLSAHFLQELLQTCLGAGCHDTAAHAALYAERYLDEQAPAPAGGESPRRLCASDEALVAALLHYWQVTRQGARALRWLARQRAALPGWLPGPRVLLLVARIAGEVRAVRWTTWSLELLLSEAQSSSSPTETELYYCLLALARCGVPRFEQVLRSLRESDLLHADDETLLFLRLQHCRHCSHGGAALGVLLRAHLPRLAPAALPGAAESLARARAVFSARCIYQALSALQEREDATFMAYYRFFLTHHAPASIELRGQWAALALAWVLMRVDRVVTGDVVYVANEVAALLPGLGSTTAVWRVLVHRCALLRLHYAPGWWAAHTATTTPSPPPTTSLTVAARNLFVSEGRASLLPSLARSSMMRFVLHPCAVQMSEPSALRLFMRATAVSLPHKTQKSCASAVWLQDRLTWERHLASSSAV